MLRDQHFLVDEKILEKICNYAELKKDERVLEIGAGTGNLTEKILQRRVFVFAIEKDPLLVDKIKTRFSNERNLMLIKGDALKLNFPEFDKVVSSLPFSISRKITEKVLMHKFKLAILVYQEEFAKKLIAKKNSKNYRFISALAQSCAEIEILSKIPNEAFMPIPKVSCVIVKLKQNNVAERNYIDFLHLLFNHRNKKIGQTLKTKLPENFSGKRVFELSPSELIQIYKEFYV